VLNNNQSSNSVVNPAAGGTLPAELPRIIGVK